MGEVAASDEMLERCIYGELLLALSLRPHILHAVCFAFHELSLCKHAVLCNNIYNMQLDTPSKNPC